MRRTCLLAMLVACNKGPGAEGRPTGELAPGAHVVPSASVDPKGIAKIAAEAGAEPLRLEQTMELVRLVYGDLHGKETRSLLFKSEPLSTGDMKRVLPLVESYNGFVGAKVASALERLRGEIAYYELGREGSPVLYVHLPYWTHQQEKNCPDQRCDTARSGPKEQSRKLEATEHAALVAKVRAVFGSVAADEIGPASNDHVLRVWWD